MQSRDEEPEQWGAVMDAAMARHMAVNFARQIMADKVAYDELVCPRLDISSDADLDGLWGGHYLGVAWLRATKRNMKAAKKGAGSGGANKRS